MEALEPQTRRWTTDEYYRMGELGWFRDQRVELIDGEIIKLPPQKDLHTAGIILTARALSEVFGEAYTIRQQFPLHFGEGFEPEPDVAVVEGAVRDYVGTGHPTTALLIVEVSDATLRYDQREKASLYASRTIADYWVLNLPERRLEVHRDPTPDPEQRFGHRYGTLTIHTPEQTAAPLAAPDSAIPVKDLLP